MAGIMSHVGQTRAGRLGDLPPLTADSAAPASVATGNPQQEVDSAIRSNRVVIFSKQVCPKCQKAKQASFKA